MLPPKELGCHRTEFKRKCFDLVTKGLCNRWRHERVQNLSTAQIEDRYDCIDNWAAQYAKDTGQLANQLGMAMESLRNELMAVVGYPGGHPEALPPGTPIAYKITNGQDRPRAIEDRGKDGT